MNNKERDSQAICDEAGQLFDSGNLEAAANQYFLLVEDDIFAPYAYYMLADISNRTGDPITSKELYYKAFTIRPDLCKSLLSPECINYDYIFTGKKDFPLVESCPLCGKQGEPIWCYPTLRLNSRHAQKHNPVRVWVYCNDCHHIYAEEFPEHDISDTSTNIQSDCDYTTYPSRFSQFSKSLLKLSAYTFGQELLEVGLGGCECALTAREMGYNVLGIDISDSCVSMAKKYGLEAQVQDFIDFCPGRQWDVIIFCDVIEHVSDPVLAIKKLYTLLKDDGVILLSTPNFDSAFSSFSGHNDPMRLEVSHKNYFSRISLFSLLEQCGFRPMEYQVSDYYNGSMQIIIVKDVYK